MKIQAYLERHLSGENLQRAAAYFRASGIKELTANNRSGVDAVIARYSKIRAKSRQAPQTAQKSPEKRTVRPVQSATVFLAEEPLKTVVPVPEQEGICPLCNGQMETVLMPDGREVFYCMEHGLVTPKKVVQEFTDPDVHTVPETDVKEMDTPE